MQQTDSLPEPSEQAWPCQPLDCIFLTFRTLREGMSVILSHQIYSTLLWQPQERNYRALENKQKYFPLSEAYQVVLMEKNLPVNTGDGDIRDVGSIPGSGRSPGGGNDNPLQYSCLENPMARGAWWATVHGVTKSWTQLNIHTDNDEFLTS